MSDSVLLGLLLGSIALLLGYFLVSGARAYVRERSRKREEEVSRTSAVNAFLDSKEGTAILAAARAAGIPLGAPGLRPVPPPPLFSPEIPLSMPSVSRASFESALRASGVNSKEADEILSGWNDVSDSKTCRMLSDLGVDRAFVEENRNTYFRKNVYDEVKPRLEARLRQAEQEGHHQSARAFKALIEVFEANRQSLQQVTEASTLLGHMSSCRKHG